MNIHSNSIDGSRMLRGSRLFAVSFLACVATALSTPASAQTFLVEASFSEADPVSTVFRAWDVDGTTGEVFVGTSLPGGTVRVYVETAPGVTSIVQEIQRPATPTNSNFGRTLAVDGDRMLVGADTSGTPPGVVFEYARSPQNSWELVGQTIDPSSGFQGFGHRVLLDGDTAIMDNFVMVRDESGVWTKLQTLPTNVLNNSGPILVGDSIFGSDGQFRINELRRGPNGLFEQFREVVAPLGFTTADDFGRAFASDGETLVVSSERFDQINELHGTVLLYRREFDGDWEFAQTLALDNFQTDMGVDVAIEGDTVLVGARWSGNVGRVYLFRALDQWNWVPVGAYEHPAPQVGDRFGETIVVDNGLFVVESVGPSFGQTGLHLVRPALLMRDRRTVSLSKVGTQHLYLRAPGGFEFGRFALLGSATGTAPGIDLGGGLVLPLNFDEYLMATIDGRGPFVDGQAYFDAWGRGEVVIQVPPALDPGLVGIVLHHAYLTFSPSTLSFVASNAVSVELVP